MLNHATSTAGSIHCELCDELGCALAGYTLADSDVLFGNAIAETVSWRGDCNIAALVGQSVRLRLRMQEADVYDIRFANDFPTSLEL